MKILSRSDEIKQILTLEISNKHSLTEELVTIILEKEKEIFHKDSILYYQIHSPIYCGPGWDGYFFSPKIYRQILYEKDFNRMNEIRSINGSTEKARKNRAERIWGKYLPSLRF